MKVKQTVAAVCLAAIMATSVGAAAQPKYDRNPTSSEGVWSHSYGNNDVGDTIKSDFVSKMPVYPSWAYAQNDKLQGEDVTKPYGEHAVSTVTQVDGRKKWYE